MNAQLLSYLKESGDAILSYYKENPPYALTPAELHEGTFVYFERGGKRLRPAICRLAAGACGCTVSAGPVEATAYGNGAIQLISAGVIGDITQAREIISRSDGIKIYQPEDTDKWNEAYEKYLGILGK